MIFYKYEETNNMDETTMDVRRTIIKPEESSNSFPGSLNRQTIENSPREDEL